jgi:hypothetical protein
VADLHSGFTRYCSSADLAFQAALTLYAEQIPEAGQTGSTEIAHWVDHGGQVTATTEAHCCGFTLDGELVGFAHWGVMQVAGESLANLDYLALHPRARTAAGLAQFLRSLTEALQACGVTRVLTEVLQDRALTRFCRMSGFQLIEAPYAQPPMGEGAPEAAALMVLGHTGPLTPATYSAWIRSLYEDYYLPWRAPFLSAEQLAQHRQRLRALAATLECQLGSDFIPLSGKGRSVSTS